MNIFQKAWKHMGVINKHKARVTRLLIKAGLYKQAILHDLSKYSPTEFLESIKFFTGTKSPIDTAKEKQGYSNAWLHHRGRNPHHYEYWIDYLDDGGKPMIIPFKYALEMVCDYIAAGQVYEGKNWSYSSPEKYWKNVKRDGAKMHPKLKDFFDQMFEIFTVVGERGLDYRNAKLIYMFLVEDVCPETPSIELEYWRIHMPNFAPRYTFTITKKQAPE